MNYTELWKWLGTEIIKEHWAKGGTSKCVKFGNPDFEPSFWLPEIWGWENVIQHPRDLSKSSFDGPGNMTEFLKKVVIKKLDLLGINASEWVSQEFTMEKKKRRERNRKKSTPSEVETTAENVHNEEQSANGESIDLENGNLEDAVGEENQNESIMTDTFEQEVEFENETSANVSDESRSDVNYTSQNQQGFATSSLREGLTRRTSERQAAKRARLETLPSLLSPISSDSESTSDANEACPPLPPQPAQPQPAQPNKFVPRRKPLATGTSGRSNFRAPLNVNVGKGLANDESLVSMSIPSNLVEIFETLAKDNTDRGMETGGILAGQQIDNCFEVTHLIIPEQIAANVVGGAG